MISAPRRRLRGVEALPDRHPSRLAAGSSHQPACEPNQLDVTLRLAFQAAAATIPRRANIDRSNRGRIYVVEFWATWCPPCLDVMPQLTALQSKYRDKLTVVGINVLESAMGQGDENSVRAFVSKGRPAMGYTVAMDDPMKQPVFTGWMISAGLCCLPTAFIVDRKGAIVWVGSTATSTSYSFDEALHDTLSDEPDLIRAGALQESTRMTSAKVLALKPALDARMKRDFEAVVTEVDRVLGQHPEYAPDAFPLKLAAMLHVNEHDGLAYVRSASKSTDLRKD